MKFTADRRALAEALTWVASVIPARPVTPIVAGVRLEAGDDLLSMRGFDYETGHSTIVSGRAHETGAVLVSGKFLAAVVNGLRAESVTIETIDSDLVITSGRSVYRARLMALEDYPERPEFPTEVGTLDAAELTEAVRAVSGPVGDDPSRPNTIGVHLEASGGVLNVLGCDPTPRSVHKIELDWDGDDFEATVSVSSLTAALRGMTGDVALGVDDGLLGLCSSRQTVTMRRYATTYLGGHWARLYKRDHTIDVIEVDAAELTSALGRLVAIAGEKESAITFALDGDGLTLTLGSDVGQGCDVVEATWPDAPLRFGVNAALLMQAVNACGTARVGLGLTPEDGTQRKAIEVAGNDRDDVRCLVMPIRLDVAS